MIKTVTRSVKHHRNASVVIEGSVANLIVAERAKQVGVTISFLAYGRIGLPLTLASLGFGTLWLS